MHDRKYRVEELSPGDVVSFSLFSLETGKKETGAGVIVGECKILVSGEGRVMSVHPLNLCTLLVKGTSR